MKKRIAIFFLFSLFLLGLFFLWFKEATLPANPISNASQIFIVKKGESIRQIANNLKKEGLIREPLAFFLLVKNKGVEKNIQAGDFRLKPSMNLYEVIEELKHGTLDVWVTILEGWRVEEIALKLAAELSIPEQEFLKYAQEGYMFPDTYLLPRQASASALAKIMRNNFEKRAVESLNLKGVNLHKIVILASLVEREAKLEEDRPKVASVLLNRLEIGMKLDIDATVQYALGYQEEEKTWWKKALSKEELIIDSPYNTYKNKGLPPTPIANPGLSSIKAVVNPAKTDYLYYLSDKEGEMHYAKTLREHNENIEKYLKLGVKL